MMHKTAQRIFGVATSHASKVTPAEMSGKNVLHYSIPNVQEYGTGATEDGSTIASDKLLINEPCILISKLNPRKSTVCLAGPADVLTVASSEFVPLTTGNMDDDRYLAWLLKSDVTTHFLDSLVSSATNSHQRVQPFQILGMAVRWPDAERRATLSQYLDRETGEIDAMIAKLDQLAETLEARRIEVIREWVRAGDSTDINDPVHPVLGRIAAGWRVAPIQTAATMKTGHTPSRQKSEYWVDTSIPWFTLADVWQLRQGRKYVKETKQTISELGLNNSSAELLPVGTVLLSRTASVGFTGITGTPLATSQDFWNWVCGPELLPEYLWYQFIGLREYFVSLTLGSTHRTIYAETAGGMRIVLPPLNEQQRIADHLEEVTSKIDAMLAKVAELKSLLTERRAALITEVVTGRKEVA